MENNMPKERSALPWLIGCGGFVLLLCVVSVVLFVMYFSVITDSFSQSFQDFDAMVDEDWGGDWGVLAPNEMSDDALAFVEDEGLVQDGETLLAYYDKYEDRSEVAVLTEQALRYQRQGRITDVPLEKVNKIKHHEREDWGEIVDVILIQYDGGQQMKVEILESEGGVTFHKMLTDAWKEAKGQK
ncbi:hypothetical protein C8J48_2946 [Desmospora activa DSM 45169]|uniref:Uncharacterized protein n=1 Tax=Desmospora activa DSM 45169 TaxID=1121389 RepID=A0A2T4Z3Z9_9BACL|nr:hypothetical protein C8J48_2946 [Desmospora activa DSM 45169]